MLVLILLATCLATWIGVALLLRRTGFSTGFGLSGGFVVACGVLALAITLLTQQAIDAPKARLAAKKPDLQHLQKKARDDRRKVTARQSEDKWSVPVASSKPECLDTAAVIMNTPSGPYLVNGTAIDRYGNTYKSSRDMGRPVPELEHDPQAKLPPPHELMQYGFKLCD